jgi:hypothetical protein
MKDKDIETPERSNLVQLSDEEINAVHGGSLASDVGQAVHSVSSSVGNAVNSFFGLLFGRR